jgi:hypothetical protein
MKLQGLIFGNNRFYLNSEELFQFFYIMKLA